MMERNEALLRKVGDVIANEPERYDQSAYIESRECGTVACIAGHARLLSDNYRESSDRILGVEGTALFHPAWRPAGDPSVPLHERVQAALYALADGADIEDVTA